MKNQPHLIEEKQRLNINNFVLQKKISPEMVVFSSVNLKKLSKGTRYLDLIFFNRLFSTFFKYQGGEKRNFFEKFDYDQNISWILSLKLGIPFFFEFLELFICQEKKNFFVEIVFFDFLSKKRKNFLYFSYLKKFLGIQRVHKKKKALRCVYKFDLFFFKKKFKAAKNCLSFVEKISEKETFSRFFSGQVAYRSGKMAFKQKKLALAFSNFLEAFEKVNRKKRLKLEKISEWILFCSNFLSKIPSLPFGKKDYFLENKKNYVFAKFLGNGLSRKDLTTIQTGIKKKWDFFNIIIRKTLTKTYFSFLKKSLKLIRAIFTRIPFTKLALIIGVSKKSLEVIINSLILKGEIHGIIDYKTKCLINISKPKNEIFVKNFLSISIHLNTILSLKIKKFI